ncbi:hypothetical protein IF188_06865 [Microbacterium sp. NEAU-LLC]|uniref:Uncharacterized protein n=1 Tax=Microbacterium helvum TaxID=2773713 RepID=A0ABR8NLU1_9MICO|nr:hypothetical protein [Microbacterium helvum]MBD3941417.1 hypothetical protein [Microbacterium helvum]
MKTALQSRARMRSAALIEPYTRSLRHVRSLVPGTAVVSSPSAQQERLEGLVLGRLGYLYDPQRGASRQAEFVPDGIVTDAGHFSMRVRGTDVAPKLHGLLPRWARGGDAVENGIPGLRYRDFRRGRGVSFFLLGQDGLVTFEGISMEGFESYRREVLQEVGEESVDAGDWLAPQESSGPRRSVDATRAASVIARRLGLLLHRDVAAIDSWWNIPERFAVELIVPVAAPDPMPAILKQIQSPYLAPRLRLERWGGGHHYLSVEGCAAEIDLRILRIPG